MSRLFVPSLAAIICLQSCIGIEYVTIQTSSGLIRGVSRDGMNKFLGVPFAHPPVGAYRFTSPAPIQKWPGIRSAIKAPSECVQWNSTGLTGSEDCLYLNVFTPSNDTAALRPVVVNIHGGGFTGGWASTDTGLPLAAGLVVFAIQYRLGVFGFFSPQLPPPNFGMQDQQAALRWVQANAASFGGDASRVMIYGCSAGGASVAGHLVLPDSFGLYSSASIASPGGHQGWMGDEERINDDWMSLALNANHSDIFLQGVSCINSTAKATLECLQNASVGDILSSGSNMRFAPSLPEEGQFPLGMIQRGHWNRVPTMIGGASCESCNDAWHDLGDSSFAVSEGKFDKALIAYGLSGVNGSGVGPDTLAQWYGSRLANEGRWRTYARILGDSGHSCNTALHAEALARTPSKTSPIWRYFFDIHSYGFPGAVHCAEILYLEHNAHYKLTCTEKMLEDALAHAMANLAANGNPNVGFPTNLSWSEYAQDSPHALIVSPSGAVMNATIDTLRPECQHWKPFLGWGEDHAHTMVDVEVLV